MMNRFVLLPDNLSCALRKDWFSSRALRMD
jgi:hypothetical protein